MPKTTVKNNQNAFFVGIRSSSFFHHLFEIVHVAGSEEFSYNKRFFKYEEEDDIYFVFLDRQYIDVYKNGKRFMQYEFKDLEDYFAPFFEKSGK